MLLICGQKLVKSRGFECSRRKVFGASECFCESVCGDCATFMQDGLFLLKVPVARRLGILKVPTGTRAGTFRTLPQERVREHFQHFVSTIIMAEMA